MLARHPRLYARLADAPTWQAQPISRDGFDVGPGWQDIVERLSRRLDELSAVLPEADRPEVVQLKQKWGRLTVYLEGVVTEEMDAAIETAGDESTRTCEECGAVGVLRRGSRGHVLTACEPHGSGE
jgi:hypothetical protein